MKLWIKEITVVLLKLTDQVIKVIEHMQEVKIREMAPGKGTTDAKFIARQLQEKFITVSLAPFILLSLTWKKHLTASHGNFSGGH